MNETQTEPTNITPAAEAPHVAEVPYDAEAAEIQARAAATHEVAKRALNFMIDENGTLLNPKEVADVADRRSIDVH